MVGTFPPNARYPVLIHDEDAATPANPVWPTCWMIVLETAPLLGQVVQALDDQSVVQGHELGRLSLRDRHQCPVLCVIAAFPVDMLQEDGHEPLAAPRTGTDRHPKMRIVHERLVLRERSTRCQRGCRRCGPARATAESVVHSTCSVNVCVLPATVLPPRESGKTRSRSYTRPATIAANDRSLSSSTLSPVALASSSLMAPQFTARRK